MFYLGGKREANRGMFWKLFFLPGLRVSLGTGGRRKLYYWSDFTRILLLFREDNS